MANRFFTIGAQTHNSSSYSEETMKKAWMGLEALGVNTVAAPIHWYLIEPEEGVFDFSQIDHLIKGAKQRKMKLVLLWFASWKNGTSQYAPEWVKIDNKRFIWAETVQHVKTRVLSPLCKATNDADRNAFAKVMAYLKDTDTDETVIGLQLENEPGMFGSPRDYSPLGEEAFNAQVPAEVIQWLENNQQGYAGKSWIQNGKKQRGTWPEVFDLDGAEMLTTYAFANFIDAVAQAGKSVYKLPMYVNTWLLEAENRIPGVGYPCGGSISSLLDFWKRFSPHIDALCPDVYPQEYTLYHEVCGAYSRDDNPLYIPESGATVLTSINTFNAIVNHGLVGIHSFGVDSVVDNDGNLKEACREYADSIKCLMNLRPLIEKYHGTDKMYAIGQYEGAVFQYIDFGDYMGVVQFYAGDALFGTKTTPNMMDTYHERPEDLNTRARGMIIYEGSGVFYLAGAGYKLMLRSKGTVESLASTVKGNDIINTRNMEYLSIAEGHFDESDNYVVVKKRCGDEADYGVWVSPDVGVVRLAMDFQADR